MKTKEEILSRWCGLNNETVLGTSVLNAMQEFANGYNKELIRDEMDRDMEESGMAQGEIESCLTHWNNKYIIIRK